MPRYQPLVALLVIVFCTTAFAADLPLRDVVLFSSGVGYFSREGAVDGDAEVELSFRTAQINDLLKSLVLQDRDGGTIAPVTYAPQEPIDRTLSSFAVDISDNPSLSELLDRLRGVKAEVKSDTTQVGAILGVETQEKSVGDRILQFEVINLLTEDGIVEVPIWHMKSVRILDEKIDADLKQALEVLATTRDVDKRPVTLHFNGTGSRHVSAGYLLETPVWKTSYRLVVDDETLHLQGWAIVENTTDDDWSSVQLTLVSGQPVSFIQTLYDPLYIARTTLPPSVTPAARPRLHEGAMDDYDEAAPPEAPAETRADRRASGAPGAEGEAGAAGAQPMMGPGMGGMMGGGGAYGGGLSAGYMDTNALIVRDLPQAMAAAGEVGELFQYVIDQPVTIGRMKSAMIPIVNVPTEGEKVSVYNAGYDPIHPMNGIKLKNTTGLNLMPGAVTVFDSGVYGGDALMDALAPDDDRLVTYARDLDVRVDQKADSRANELISVKVVRGTAIITHKQRIETTYTAKSVSGRKRALLIEHPLRNGWKLLEPEKPAERTSSLYRFRVELAPKATENLNVVEEHPVSETVVLTDVNPDAIVAMLTLDKLSPEIEAALQKIVEIKTEQADATRQLAEREGRLEEISKEQERIRQNMEQLDRDSELYKRYVDKFTEQEDEYERLQAEIKTLEEKAEQLRKQLEDYVLALNLE